MVRTVNKLAVIAHRGACLVAVENTLDAFERAFAQGADGIETDVRLTRDGTLVLFHDATVERLAGRPDAIADLTWPELRDLPLDGPESAARACRLEDVYPLIRARGARLLLDLKPPVDYAPAFRRSLADAHMEEHTILGIRTVEELRTVQEALPGLSTLGFGASLDLEWALADARADVLIVRSNWVSAENVERARAYGRPIWTLGGGRTTGVTMGTSTVEELIECRRLGFQGAIVNDVELAVRANAVPVS
jgi:glycerophosphoryl diester phosphodiesterase